MTKKSDGIVRATSRAQYNAGYMPGFGNDFETEAAEGAVPIGQNSPQRCPYGLYAEQLSGTPFTAPRASNERTWLYRMRPTVQHIGDMVRVDLPQAARVQVTIYDVLGRRVLTTPTQDLEAGAARAVPVDARTLASGLYLYRVVARTATETFTGTGRMTVVR